MNGASASSSSAELARTEAMMEGTRMLIDSLREKVAALEDRCEKMDREKVTTLPSQYESVAWAESCRLSHE